MSNKLEYKIETFEAKEFLEKKHTITQKINVLGKAGWKLSQMDSIIAEKVFKNPCTTHFVLVFEREI